MKKGDKVKIYEDPITCKRLEGVAVLVKQIPHHGCIILERWKVHFINDDPGDAYERTALSNSEILQ